MEVRKVTKQGMRLIEARLRWRGYHPETGAPWKGSWRPLWENGKPVMNGVLEDEARLMADEVVHYGEKGDRVRRRAAEGRAGSEGRQERTRQNE